MAATFCFNFEIPEENPDILTEKETDIVDLPNGFAENRAEFVTPNVEEVGRILNSKYEVKTVEIPEDLADRSSESKRMFLLFYLSEDYVQKNIKECEEYSSSATSEALQSNKDLIPFRYEGGMTIWESSIDLVMYMNKLLSENVLTFKEKTVLELGCGGGLPGLYAYMKGANVFFQDYNPEVLKLFTIPNLALNTMMRESENTVDFINKPKFLESCKFVSGSWEFIGSLMEPKSFDIILTSETIYNVDTQETLYNLIKYCLKDSGIVLVAAKSYYFGVGGGTDTFTQLVKKDDRFHISSYLTCSIGVKREILIMENIK